MMNKSSKDFQQRGQVVIILLLVMVVALAIGLSIIGRSVNEISTSTKTEESSRAFSAAEAGIERLLGNDPTSGIGSLLVGDLGNQSQATVNWDADLPKAGQALEYPFFGKESFAQFWLANPGTLAASYNQPSFDIYFGQARDYINNRADEPAIEVHVVYLDSSNQYRSNRYFYDSYIGDDPVRINNGFSRCVNRDMTVAHSGILINTTFGPNEPFYCQVSVPTMPNGATGTPIMARVRILYSSLAHPVALQPTGGSSLPPQIRIYIATGSAGLTQRTLRVFREKYVLPQFLDYVLFSAGSLRK